MRGPCYTRRTLTGTSILLALALSGPTQVRGRYEERSYTGACDVDGRALWEERPVGGKKLFVRVAGEVPAPALAGAVTGPDGEFATSFQPPAAGEYCVAHEGRDRLVCLATFTAGPIEGSAWTSVNVGPANTPPRCVSQRRRVHGRTVLVDDPCGDEGGPPRPAAGKRVWIVDAQPASPPRSGGEGGRGLPLAVVSDAEGRFEARLLPGRYCVRLDPRAAEPGKPVADGCAATFEVADRDVEGLRVGFRRTCGDAEARRLSGQEPLPAGARGVGRVQALGGTLHVRGVATHQGVTWGGAARREPPPPLTAGNVIRVRRGETNGAGPVVAEVRTDEHGFDVALPPGTWCFETAFHDEAFEGWAKANAQEFDRACLRESHERCDLVVRLDDRDVEDARIVTTDWTPPGHPCRIRPWSGAMPP